MGAALAWPSWPASRRPAPTTLLALGQPTLQALTGGYALGFVIAGGCVASAVAVAAAVLCARPQAPATARVETRQADASTRRDAPRAALPSQQRVDLAHLPGRQRPFCLARRSFLPPVRRS